MNRRWRNDQDSKEQEERESYQVIITPNISWMLGSEEHDLPFEGEEMAHKVGNRTYLILVIYDIVENKRRCKLAKVLEGYGVRVQYSAFECHLTIRMYEKMINHIVSLIDQDEDLLRVYRLTGSNEIKMWGRVKQTYNEDVIII